MNLTIKIDLSKLRGASIVELQVKTGKKACLVIPIEDSDLFRGKRGLYLNAKVIEDRLPKFDQTHYIKPEVIAERYKAMTEDERFAIPIIGHGKAYESRQGGSTQPADQELTGGDQESNGIDNDLPF